MPTSSPFISLDPNTDLEFRKPFTQVVKQSLYVVNLASSPVAFKVKTTAPKQYCVRPNSGRIEPNAKVEVQVLLQAMKEDPPEDFKCKDRFLVQSIKIPNDLMKLSIEEAQPRLLELWSQAEQLKKTDPEASSEILCEQKLKCAYLAAAATESGPTPPYTYFQTNFRSSPVKEAAPVIEVSKSESAPAGESKELGDAKDQIKRLTAACEGYKAEIERLNSIRQRKAGEVSASDVKVKTVSVQGAGIPLQMAAIIALVAFFLGILLF